MVASVEISTSAGIRSVIRPLWRKFPALNDALPILPIADLPTPVELLPTLGDDLSIPGLFIKRDDLSGALYGGTKVRAAEVILGAAYHSGKKHLLCTSVAASNWLSVCAIYGKALDLKVHLLGLARTLDDNKKNNLQIQQALADQIIIDANPLQLLRHGSRLWWRHRRDIFYAAPGGTSAASCLAYVNAMFELAEQIRAKRLPEPKYIFCGLGSCGTAAGLALGAVLAGLHSHLIAIRIADRIVSNRWNAGRLIWSAMYKLHRADRSATLTENPLRRLHIEHRYIGPGYGKTYASAERMKELMLNAVGVSLDDTYTAKTVWGMADYCRRHHTGKAPVLYWHSLNSQPVVVSDLHDRVRGLARDYQKRELTDARAA